MEEELKDHIDNAEMKMQKAVDHLDHMLGQIRAGKATTNILDSVFVDYYGAKTPLSQVANLSTPDARTIAIQPWEKALIEPIERGIMLANLGLTPENNGELIRVNIPMLTEERRRDLVKQVKSEGEDAKISIRSARREVNDIMKKMIKDGLSKDLEKDAEGEVQILTDKYGKLVDEMIARKESDIMTV